MAKIVVQPFLLPLSQLFMVAAVLAWAATFAGLVDSRLNCLRVRDCPIEADAPCGSAYVDREEVRDGRSVYSRRGIR